MQSYRAFLPLLLSALAGLAPATSQAATPGPPANVVMVAGNGQVVQTNFPTTVPLTIRVTDANSIPVPGVAVSWSITQGADKGTLNQPTGQTDSNGVSTSNFIGNFVPPGESFVSYTVTAATVVGSVNFVETAVPFTNPSGSLAQPPYVQLNVPTADNLVVTGTAGATLPGAVQVAVVALSGINQGQGIPNVGLRIVSTSTDPSVTPPPPPATCNAPAGIALSSSSGLITCDLVLGNTPGTYTVNALVGEFQNTRSFTIRITQATTCNFVINPTFQSFGPAMGTGSVNVTAPAGCAWTATSNVSFLTITSVTTGSGNGTVFYSVSANTGPARPGNVTIGGQIFSVNQAAVGTGPGPLTITSGQNLPGAIVGSNYSATISASGGQQPYQWSVSVGNLPLGLSLNSSGTISGVPTTAGTFSFTVQVSDIFSSQQQTFNITISAAGSGGGLTITNSGFPNGIAGVPYSQVITFSPVPCGSPFSPGPVITLQSGTLPPGLSVQSNGAGYSIAGTPTATGSFNFTLAISNTCGQSGSASFTITITGTGTTTILGANPTGFTFSVAPGGSAQTQQLTVTSTGMAVAIAATASTSSGGNWLFVTPASSTTTAVLNVTVDAFQSLPPGTYQGSITITASGNNTLTVPVTLTVTSSAVGLTVIPTALPFNVSTNSSSQQILTVTSNGTNVPIIASAQTFTGGSWLAVQSNSAITPATLTVTVNASALPPGTFNGTITISASNAAPLVIPVSLVVSRPSFFVDPKSLAFNASGPGVALDPQTINLFFSGGTPFSLTASTTTLAGGNWLFVNQPASIPTAITVSVNTTGLARGTYNGTVTLTPADNAITPIKIPVMLTVGTGPGPVVNGVVNAASFTPGPVAPGEILTLFGAGMGPANLTLLALTPSNTVATSLAGTQVLFDNIPAPLVYVSATQVSAIVPYEIYGRIRTQLVVTYNGVPSLPVDLGVAFSAPGIFTVLQQTPPSIPNQAAALNQDGSVNAVGNGAAPGSIVTLFGTGEGQTSPAGITGAITDGVLSQPLQPVSVRIGGLPADTTYAGSAPGEVAGVLQVNVRIPTTVPRGGQVQVTLTIGDATSNQASIAIVP